MQVTRKIGVSVGVLTIGTILTSCLLLWFAQRVEENQRHLSHAYVKVEAYLELSNTISESFSKMHLSLMNATEVPNLDIDGVEEKVTDLVARIDALEQTDELQGVSKTADLQFLKAELKATFDGIRASVDQMAQGERLGSAMTEHRMTYWQAEPVHDLIRKCMAKEKSQLAVSYERTRKFDRFVNTIAVLVAFIALATALATYSMYVKWVQGTFGALTEGAAKFGEDDLSHRINLEGDDEFATLGNQLDIMAQRIQTKQDRLTEIQSDLEQQVVNRTFALHTANVELEQRDASQRHFFAQIGHELRTPVTAIRGEAEVALRAKQDPHASWKAALETIIIVSGQLMANVSDLFVIARGELRLLKFEKAEMDLGETALDAVNQLRGVYELRSGSLEFFTLDTDFTIQGEKHRITQLMHILLNNAITHGHMGIKVGIQMTATQDTVGFDVWDDGPGIPVDQWDKLFDVTQDDANLSGKTALGTGIGLPLAKSIVTGHDGNITIGECPKGGTRISVSFPIISGKEADENSTD
jgi:two-component system OmpR family sensor kinase